MGKAERLDTQTAMALDDARPFEGLTTAQHKMVMLMFSGLQQTEAYRAVYDTSHMQESSIYSAARDMAAKPLVVAKLREMRQRAEAQATLAPNLTRNFVLNGVMGLALSASKESVQLAAYQTLGKTVGIDLFRDVHLTEKVTRTPDDVDKELKTRLLELQQRLTIDASANKPDAPGDTATPRDRRRKPSPG